MSALGFMDRVGIWAGSGPYGSTWCEGTVWGRPSLDDSSLSVDRAGLTTMVMWDGPSWSPNGNRWGVEMTESLEKLSDLDPADLEARRNHVWMEA